LDAKSLEKNPKNVDIIKQFDGIIVPGGFGTEGTEGKILAINYARTHNIPYLGLCYGMQLALIEFARNVCKMKNANTTEINPNTPYPIIDFIPMQKEFIQNHAYGGTMRLGAYGAIINKNSLIYNLYKKTKRIEIDKKQIKILQKDKQNKFRLGKFNKNTDTIILERHRHRYEVNPKYVETLEKAGIKFTGYHVRNDGTKLMEFIELPQHKFFVATQAHPEFKSRLNNPAPLFLGFVKACLSKTNKISNSK
jgi:CTP synthase